MASSINFQPPAGLHGSNEQQLRQMYSYLFQMSEKLNVALSQVDEQIATGSSGGTAVVQRPSSSGGSSSGGLTPDITQQYQELRALIIKTAEEIRLEMDGIETTLTTEYIAKSDWGEYRQEIITDIDLAADGLRMELNYDESIKALNDAIEGLQSYDVSSLQYIKLGIIGRDDNGKPIVGLLIGEEFTTITYDGIEYNAGQNTYAAYTSDKVSFFNGETEMAYLSNSTLYITHIEMPNGGKFKHGDWQTDTDNGYSITWIGEEGANGQ